MLVSWFVTALVLRLALAEEPVMEVIDRVIVGQQLTISCPFKNILDSGMFWWFFEPHNKDKQRAVCTKIVGQSDCIKSNISETWLSSIKVISFNIIIDKISFQHAGIFQCKYMDSKSIERHFFKVNVLTPPGKPQIHTIPVSLTENSMVKLVCSSEGGNPQPTLKWLWKDFSNNPISQERRINSTMTPSNSTFGVTNLTSIWLPKSSEDGNSISCQAKNSLATISSNWMYLNINYPPVIYGFPMETYHGLLGGEVSVECKAASKTTATFKWISPNGNVISDGSYLIINQLRNSDKGSYSCVVTNSVGTSSATLDIKVLSSPMISVARSVTVNEWDTLNVICNAVPVSANISWWLGDMIISTSNNLRYEIRDSHSFEVQCRASVLIKVYSGQQTAANSMKTITIIVQHVPHKPTISANPIGIMMTGTDVTITCIGNKTKPGLPKPDYSWRKLDSDWTRNGTNFLTLSSLRFDDAGIYGCKLFNKLGSSNESVYDLQVEGPPYFDEPKTSIPKNIFVRIGRSFKIECKFQSRPIPIIKWYRNDMLIMFNKNVSGFNVDNNVLSDSWIVSVLFVDESDMTSEEYYRCLGENKYGSISQEFLITVIYPPKMISNVYILAANTTAMLPYKESVSINCSVSASPNISITWIRKMMNYNERNIENDTDKYFIVETKLKRISGVESILYIRNFQNDDYGRYLCYAKNSEGHVEIVFDIRKFSIPDPAYDLVVESKSWNTLSLKWKSGFDGGYPQIFTVSYTNNMQKHPIQIRTTQPNVTLIDLLPDVLYFVNISSSNIIGTGTSTLFIKEKTSELMVDRDQIFSVSKDERIIEFSLPSNLSEKTFCLTIEQMEIQKDLIGNWSPVKKCIRNDIKKLQIKNPYDRFRVKICLISNPDVCSGSINQRLDSFNGDTLVSAKLIGTVAAICTALVIVLAILLFFILIRSRKFLPVLSDLKVIKRNRKSSYSKDDNANFNAKSSTPLCPKKKTFIKEPGGCPLMNTYSCDQVNINGNPIEILNVCPPHNIYMEGLYSTLVKSSSISPFPYDLIPSGALHQSTPDNASSCCCHEDQQAFSMSLPASRTSKPNKIIYEVMV